MLFHPFLFISLISRVSNVLSLATWDVFLGKKCKFSYRPLVRTQEAKRKEKAVCRSVYSCQHNSWNQKGRRTLPIVGERICMKTHSSPSKGFAVCLRRKWKEKAPTRLDRLLLRGQINENDDSTEFSLFLFSLVKVTVYLHADDRHHDIFLQGEWFKNIWKQNFGI